LKLLASPIAHLCSGRDHELLEHGLGLTDVVKERAASSNRRLRPSDYNVADFISRVERARPAILAFLDGDAIRAVAREIGVGPSRPSIGPVPWAIAAAKLYRLPSPSGTNTHMNGAEKASAWEAFGEWVRSVEATTD
jgi:G:T/U-mismatch repair DNA glycosylase